MNKDVKYILVLIILAYFFFFFGNGLVSLTSPDEVFYVQTAKEMLKHHSWMTPILFDEPQFEKPILIYWLLRIAFLIFGISSFSARFFPACFALGGIIAVYFFAKLLFREEKKGFVSASVLLSSCLYIGLARTVFTDMVFSVLILFSLLGFYWGYRDERHKRTGILLFFVSGALAVLTKGPLGLLIPFMSVIVFLLLARRIRFILCKDTFLGLIIFFAIALPWYIFMAAKYNQGFIREFFYNDHYRRLMEAEHSGNDTWYFYPLTMIGCMFPWSIFVGVALFYTFWPLRKANRGNLFLASWITVIFLIFQFVHSKLTSYIFPMFPALAMVCGNCIFDFISDKGRQRQFFVCSVLMWFISLLIISGIIVFGLKFSYYLSSLRPIYFLISVLILWLAITGLYLLKNKSFVVSYLFIFFVPIFMLVVPFIHRDIEPYFSSKYACEYLLSNCSIDPKAYLLCSKDFVRGTRFYTDMKTAVFAPYAKNFFSPHPVIFLDTDAKARQFLHQQSLTYGFLKKSSLEDLKRVASDKFEYQVLKNIGNQYIVKIQPK
jgi:4-amino-4-deoxy-L-arabinose transferase-like glycosyltransferase